jgi:hypothetical protein
MDFLTYEQAKQAKEKGFFYPPDSNGTYFGMLFESEKPTFQYAFVGTGQWDLFKQHCLDHGVFRATPTDLLRAMPRRWALYIEEKHAMGEEWICQDLSQDVEDAFEVGLNAFRGKSPVEATFKAWSFIQSKK